MNSDTRKAARAALRMIVCPALAVAVVVAIFLNVNVGELLLLLAVSHDGQSAKKCAYWKKLGSLIPRTIPQVSARRDLRNLSV